MGYSTGPRGMLCCDSCGVEGGCKRRNCPHGYCPAWVACEACWKDPARRQAWKQHHVDADCKGSSARFAAERAATQALMDAGEYVFCASVYADETQASVRCWFRGASGETKELVVSTSLRETFGRATTHTAALAAATAEYEAGRQMASERRDALAAFDAEFGTKYGEVA